MFRSRRLSRQPEKPVNLGALAAASAIGNAMSGNGRTVDANKIPQYNTNDPYSRRSSGIYGSNLSVDRTSSMRLNSLSKKEKSPSVRHENRKRNNQNSSRNNSLTNNKLHTRKSVDSLPRSSSMPNSQQKNNITSESTLRKQKRISSVTSSVRYNSIDSVNSINSNDTRTNSINNNKHNRRRTSKASDVDVKKTFQEFGGGQVPNVLTRSTSMMIKKYIPGPNGLVAVNVEVPVEQPVTSKVLRRSVSTANLVSNSRERALTSKTSTQSLKETTKMSSRSSSLSSLSSSKSLKKTAPKEYTMKYDSPNDRRTSSLSSQNSHSPVSKNLKALNESHEMHSFTTRQHKTFSDDVSQPLMESALEEETEIELENDTTRFSVKPSFDKTNSINHPIIDQSEMNSVAESSTPSKISLGKIEIESSLKSKNKFEDNSNYLFRQEIQNTKEDNNNRDIKRDSISTVEDDLSPKRKEMRRLISDSILLEESMNDTNSELSTLEKNNSSKSESDFNNQSDIQNNIDDNNSTGIAPIDKRISRISVTSSDYASLNDEKKEILKLFDDFNNGAQESDVEDENVKEVEEDKLEYLDLNSVTSTLEDRKSLSSSQDRENTIIIEGNGKESNTEQAGQDKKAEETEHEEPYDVSSAAVNENYHTSYLDTYDTSTDSNRDSNLIAIDNISIGDKSEEIIPSREEEPKKETSKLAKNIRESSPFFKPDVKAGELTSVAASSKKNKRNSKISPIKSAMKKNTSNLNLVLNYNDNPSAANQAYLSLTTAENTRLNSGLTSSENVLRKPATLKSNRNSKIINYPRSQSINSDINGLKTKNDPQINIDRYSKSNINSNYQASQSEQDNIPKRHPGRKQKKTVTGTRQPIQKQSNRMSMQAANTQLYPNEPAPKRSSFEKQRNIDSKMGFKSMSLRDRLENEQGSEQQSHQHSALADIAANGWKSRFVDSDDDDSDFMGILNAPKPLYMEAGTMDRSLSEVNSQKISNKKSKLSLRSASMVDKVSGPATNVQPFEKQPTRMTMSSQSLQKNNDEYQSTPEKKTFGTKLKKLFGRKKDK
ncbi:hypothetical protein TPHA_0C03850 [Tetrapisispora phaffii CBS 4417]|uniref:Eisosome protein SEG1 n=1 Tax=Tetrapisispora phaffii (strain ATCC 24235 / CBS 4417 / NBRC 1672 / NRRL Y-8282 / UCD 70-5) TaxID=1071381 RepID=G8BQM5_TETPH|nr:hypothetical protein TPHA_0C03850 [Tetrapisispora phaffii CBS 4417]CCE62537.1 hypothetical protein TPHA_0C03850 [Tetrapisispora phaffii CBS 4417]